MKHVNIGLLYEATESIILFHHLKLIFSYLYMIC